MHRSLPCVIWKLLVASLGVSFTGATLPAADSAAMTVPVSRETRVIDGIAFEFSSTHEALVAALAPRLVAFNAEPSPPPSTPKKPAADDDAVTLSVVELNAARSEYLEAVAKLSGRSPPTPLQLEAFDMVTRHGDKVISAFAKTWTVLAEAEPVQLVIIWDRPELMRRLKAGEEIAGFTLSEDGESGNFQWGFERSSQEGEQTVPGATSHLNSHLRHQIVSNRIIVAGELAIASASGPPAEAKKSAGEKARAPTVYVIVLGEAHARLSPEGLVEKIYKDNFQAIRGYLRSSATQFSELQLEPHSLAFVALKEAARIGLNEHFGAHASELRWISEGAARYIAWRILEERHSPETALAAFDLREQLGRDVALRGNVDFATWKPADQKAGSEAQRLNEAHQTYAAMVFFVMAQRFGVDSVPRFLGELARTPTEKLNRKIVEKAFRKTTGKELNALLAEVVKPAPKAKANSTR